jgi:hypothetical protein
MFSSQNNFVAWNILYKLEHGMQPLSSFSTQNKMDSNLFLAASELRLLLHPVFWL